MIDSIVANANQETQ